MTQYHSPQLLYYLHHGYERYDTLGFIVPPEVRTIFPIEQPARLEHAIRTILDNENLRIALDQFTRALTIALDHENSLAPGILVLRLLQSYLTDDMNQLALPDRPLPPAEFLDTTLPILALAALAPYLEQYDRSAIAAFLLLTAAHIDGITNETYQP